MDGFGNFVNIEFQMLSASYIMNVESPMDRTKNRFCHRPVYPFKALAISSNLIKELSLAVHSTPVTGESIEASNLLRVNSSDYSRVWI